MRAKTLTILLLVLLHLITQAQDSKKDPDKIQLAILLDVSGSMSALIAQTRSQVWRMAEYLNTGKKEGKKAVVEFALITFGGSTENYHVDASYTYINSYFSPEIDSLASQLMQLEASGFEEHGLMAIDRALNQLNWSKKKNDLRLIVIAGNEPIEVGSFDPVPVAKKAKSKDVSVNVISCTQGGFDSYQAAAEIFKSKLFTLSLNDSTPMQKTFLDYKLIEFNNKRNNTYLPYGPNGEKNFNRMVRQDKNAELGGMQDLRNRIFFKISPAYNNPSWDLVDAYRADSTILDRVNTTDLPRAIAIFDPPDRLYYLKTKAHFREGLNDAIKIRYEFIGKYIDTKQKTIERIVVELANEKGRKKGFSFAPPQ